MVLVRTFKRTPYINYVKIEKKVNTKAVRKVDENINITLDINENINMAQQGSVNVQYPYNRKHPISFIVN